MRTSTALNALRRIDPAGQSGSPNAFRAAQSASDPALLQILDSPIPPQTHRPTQVAHTISPARRWTLIGAAAATVVGAGLFLTHTAEPAFASWTPAPTEATDGIVGLDPDCGDTWIEGGGDTQIVHRLTDIVLEDVRGDYVFTIRSDGNSAIQCLRYLPSGTGWSLEQDGWGFEQPVEISPLDEAVDGITTDVNDLEAFNGHAAAIAFGRVTPDITGVSATMPDGQVVAATVQNGWWGLWVPSEQWIPETAEITLADGSVSTVEIPSGFQRGMTVSITEFVAGEDGNAVPCEEAAQTDPTLVCVETIGADAPGR